MQLRQPLLPGAGYRIGRQEAVFASLLFRWKYRGNSLLYVGFNFLQEEDEGESPGMFFVKATYSF